MKQPQPASPGARPYQAISIHHGVTCCTVAKKASGIRVLSRNAPPLPLAECTMRDTCKCQYIKHQDRRGESRRMMDYGFKPQLFAAKENRVRRGRRAKD